MEELQMLQQHILQERSAAAVRILQPTKCKYKVGGETVAVFWRDEQGDIPCWTICDNDNGIKWSDHEPLNEFGRRMLLKHFGLESIAAHLPLEKIVAMSPRQLEKKRRAYEDQHGLERLDIVSSRPGDHVEARLAA